MSVKRYVYILLAALFSCALCACGAKEADEAQKQVVLRYSGEDIYLDEVYIYAETVKELYEEKYGSDVWNQTIQTKDGLEMDAETAARREAIDKLVRTKTLIAKSDEYGIYLTEQEKNVRISDAERFYEILTDEQIAASGLTQETVQRVLSESALADKIYEYVMNQSSTEISDEQARMSTFYDMFFECYVEDDYGNITMYSQSKIAEQKEKAEAVYETIQEQSDNPELKIAFLGSTKELAYAGTHTMSRDEILSTYGQDVLDVLYSLSDGEISQVVQTQYGYHIFQMTSLTDADATAENKDKLTEAADAEYYSNLMSEWIEELDSGYSYSKRVNEDVYDEITFGEETK